MASDLEQIEDIYRKCIQQTQKMTKIDVNGNGKGEPYILMNLQ